MDYLSASSSNDSIESMVINVDTCNAVTWAMTNILPKPTRYCSSSFKRAIDIAITPNMGLRDCIL